SPAAMKPATPILMRELVMCVLVGSHLVVLSNGEGRERPRFAVWGARMNLRKAGGTAVCQPRFRLPRNRGVHNARPRGSLECNVGSAELPNITSKAGNVNAILAWRAGWVNVRVKEAGAANNVMQPSELASRARFGPSRVRAATARGARCGCGPHPAATARRRGVARAGARAGSVPRTVEKAPAPGTVRRRC